MLKINKLKLKNFAQFIDFECEFNGNITRLVGLNGSGKTTVGLTAIWAGFKGIAEKSRDGQLIGERFRFIGKKGRSADIELTLIDETKKGQIVLKRHITKDTNQISFEATDNYKVDENWLTNLLNMSFLSTKHFTSLNGEQQARALGIDVSNFDKDLANNKETAKYLRRDLNTFGELQEVEKTESVNIVDLVKQRDEILKFNNEQQTQKNVLRDAENKITNLQLQETKIQTELKEVQERIVRGQTYIKALVKPKDFRDSTKLDLEISTSEEVNRKAEAYKVYMHQQKAKDNFQTQLNKSLSTQKEIITQRSDHIQSFNFGFAGLEVNENGQLTLDNKPIREPYFSRSELEIITAKLHASINPELQVRFIDDFECLDLANQEKLVKNLVKQGFQIIVAEVGDEVVKDNTILLRECKLVKKVTEPKQETIL